MKDPKQEWSLFGLGPKGQPLDIPDPHKDLPARVRGRLVRIAWACAYIQARAGRTAAQCPHKECELWPHRQARWPEAESGKGDSHQLHAHLRKLTGDDPPNMRFRCNANPAKQRCKLPNVGWIGSTFSGVGGVVATDLKSTLTVTLCEVCGKEITGRRKTLKYCSGRCRLRAKRGRDKDG